MDCIDWLLRCWITRRAIELIRGIGKAAINTNNIFISLPNRFFALFSHASPPQSIRAMIYRCLGLLISCGLAIKEGRRNRLAAAAAPPPAGCLWRCLDLISRCFWCLTDPICRFFGSLIDLIRRSFEWSIDQIRRCRGDRCIDFIGMVLKWTVDHIKDVGYTFEMLINTFRQFIIYRAVLRGKPEEAEKLDSIYWGLIPIAIMLIVSCLIVWAKSAATAALAGFWSFLRGFGEWLLAPIFDGVNVWVIINSIMAMAAIPIIEVETQGEALQNLIIGSVSIGVVTLATIAVKFFSRCGSACMTTIANCAPRINLRKVIELVAATLTGIQVIVEAIRSSNDEEKSEDRPYNITQSVIQLLALILPLFINCYYTRTLDGEPTLAPGGPAPGPGPGEEEQLLHQRNEGKSITSNTSYSGPLVSPQTNSPAALASTQGIFSIARFRLSPYNSPSSISSPRDTLPTRSASTPNSIP